MRAEEVKAIQSHMSLRDRALFTLGIRAGFRASELLSLNVSDVRYSDDTIRETVTVAKRNTKGKQQSRTVPMHPEAASAIKALLDSRRAEQDQPLFISSRGARLDRVTVTRNFKTALERSGIRDDGRLGTHCWRKTFALGVYEAVDRNILDLQHAMGHKQLSTTANYIQVDIERINEVIKKLK